MRGIVLLIMANLIALSLQSQDRKIITAVPYLLNAPDARGTGLGTIGAASSPDAFSMHWNAAKYAFLDKRFGFADSYTPWYYKLAMGYEAFDIHMSYEQFNAYVRIKDRWAIATSMVYYAYGSITFTDEYGNALGTYNPYNFYNDLSVSYRISKVISVGLTGRFIYSNLTLGQYIQGAETKPGMSGAADLSVYYEKGIKLGGKDGTVTWGVNLSNIGSKMTYTKLAIKEEFLPTNLKVGAGLKINFDASNSLTALMDFNKLQVPTPPVYARDSLGNPVYDNYNKPVIAEGKDPNVSVLKGIVQSWYDAPGGFGEEMKEWSFGFGFEYWLKTLFSARSGFYYENRSKGDRRYFTLGAGMHIGYFGLDMGAYIPFEKTDFKAFNLRLSLMLEINRRDK